MNRYDERALLVRIARLYYEQDLTQAQIAQQLGIYRTTISRLLKRIREQGIVTITIHAEPARCQVLEQQLRDQLGLREVVVVADGPGDALQALGQAGSQLLGRLLRAGDRIGFSWGSGVAAAVEQLQPAALPDLTCLPLVGGPAGQLASRYHVNTLVYQAAQRLKARSLLIDYPAIFEQQTVLEAIDQTPHVRIIRSQWEQMDVALFGIGSPRLTGEASWQAFYGQAAGQFTQAALAGDICSQFFDAAGEPVATPISGRTLAVPLATLRRIRWAIGIAQGPDKVAAILAAARGGYLNTLITTRATAEALLQPRPNGPLADIH